MRHALTPAGGRQRGAGVRRRGRRICWRCGELQKGVRQCFASCGNAMSGVQRAAARRAQDMAYIVSTAVISASILLSGFFIRASAYKVAPLVWLSYLSFPRRASHRPRITCARLVIVLEVSASQAAPFIRISPSRVPAAASDSAVKPGRSTACRRAMRPSPSP